MVTAQKNIIFALDAGDIKRAKEYANRLMQIPEIKDKIFAIKVGLYDVINNGLSIIKIIKDITKLPIICDLKLSDIPSVSGDIAKRAIDAGADYIVVQGFVGKSVIDAIIERSDSAKIIVVTEMTHNSGGFTHKYAEEIALLAKQERVFGIIGPGNRPKRLEEISNIAGSGVNIIAAGLSQQQGGEDWRAIDAGANYIIQGDSIRKQLDKIKVNVLLNMFVEIVSAAVIIIIVLFLLKILGCSSLSRGLITTATGAFIAICIHYVRIWLNKK